MARQARLDYENSVHHVMGRGIGKRPIFADDCDRTEFLRRLGNVCSQCAVKVYAWSLMPNHFHLLLRRSSIPLGMAMQRLLCGYAQWFNRRHERSGRLFQNRYKSKLVQTELYLARLVRYIHRNPEKAGIVDLDDLRSYPWTGHAALMGSRVHEWHDMDNVMSYFGDSMEEARQSLESFMRRDEPEPEELGSWVWMLGFGERKRKCPVPALGSEEFRRRLAVQADSPPEDLGGAHPGKLAAVMGAVCTSMKVNREKLRAGKRDRAHSRARAVISHVGTGMLGLTCIQVSRFLGVTPQSVNMCAKRGERILNRSEEIRRAVLSALGQ